MGLPRVHVGGCWRLPRSWDFRAELYDGLYHDVDSSGDVLLRWATRLSFRKGIMDASPVLPEPIMNVEVTVPEQFGGRRHGRKQPPWSHHGHGGPRQAAGRRAQAQRREVFRYATSPPLHDVGRGKFRHAVFPLRGRSPPTSPRRSSPPQEGRCGGELIPPAASAPQRRPPPVIRRGPVL